LPAVPEANKEARAAKAARVNQTAMTNLQGATAGQP
jgi:hypothetical protein